MRKLMETSLLTLYDRTNDGTPAEPAFLRLGTKEALPETIMKALSTGAPARQRRSPGEKYSGPSARLSKCRFCTALNLRNAELEFKSSDTLRRRRAFSNNRGVLELSSSGSSEATFSW